MIKIIRKKVKTLYTRSKIPGIEWSVNQYVGCQFACKYCYAKEIVRREESWGTWVEVKVNAPDLARRRVKGTILMSSVSDPYQPIEAKLKLTRSVLRFMDKRNELMILTKSPLVVRDVDVLKLFPRVEVGLTVNSFEGKEKKLFEPLTPIQRARINALKALYEEGIKNYAFISPIIPGITDVEEIIRETRDFVGWYFLEFLNLRKAGEEFRKNLEEEFPESYAVLTDYDKFTSYLRSIKDVLKRLNVRVEGIETHK